MKGKVSLVRMTLDGNKQMKDRLLAIAREMPKLVRRAAKDYAAEKVEKARERAPLFTGRLRRSGRVTSNVSGKNITATMKFGGHDVPYAAVIHWGRDGRSGNRFLQETIIEAVPTAGQELAEKIDLRKAAGK